MNIHVNECENHKLIVKLVFTEFGATLRMLIDNWAMPGIKRG